MQVISDIPKLSMAPDTCLVSTSDYDAAEPWFCLMSYCIPRTIWLPLFNVHKVQDFLLSIRYGPSLTCLLEAVWHHGHEKELWSCLGTGGLNVLHLSGAWPGINRAISLNLFFHLKTCIVESIKRNSRCITPRRMLSLQYSVSGSYFYFPWESLCPLEICVLGGTWPLDWGRWRLGFIFH